MVMMRALCFLSFLFGLSSSLPLNLFAAELRILNEIETQSERLDCDFFDWFRSCKHPQGFGTGIGEAGFISNGSVELVKRRAIQDAEDRACAAAREQAKAATPECDSFCHTRFFILEVCEFTYESIESGIGEAPQWHDACRFRHGNSEACDRYNPDQPFWALARVRASAQVTRFCEKNGQRC